MVLTDGSVWPGPVGCDACAAVLVPLLGEDEYHDSKPVGNRVTSVTCELEGIVLGLELCVNYFRVCKQRKSKESVYIFVTVLLQLMLLLKSQVQYELICSEDLHIWMSFCRNDG